MLDKKQYCTFFVDTLFLGVEVETVQEIIRPQRITRVPLASPVVRGLINLRGQIVTALDMRRRLGLTPRATDADAMNVVCLTEDGIVSLLVDKVGDVLDVGSDDFEHPPETVNEKTRELVRGAYKLENRLMLALHTEKVISLSGH